MAQKKKCQNKIEFATKNLQNYEGEMSKAQDSYSRYKYAHNFGALKQRYEDIIAQLDEDLANNQKVISTNKKLLQQIDQAILEVIGELEAYDAPKKNAYGALPPINAAKNGAGYNKMIKNENVLRANNYGGYA